MKNSIIVRWLLAPLAFICFFLFRLEDGYVHTESYWETCLAWLKGE